MAEIDDTELENLRKGKALLDKMLASPKTKRTTEKVIKELYPETVISDDFDAPVLDAIGAIGKKVDTFLETQAAREGDSRLDQAFSKIRADGGFSDDGIDKIKNLMIDRKIADPFAAAALYEKMNPPPAPQKPTSFAGLGWGFGRKTGDQDLDLLFTDEDAWAEKQAIAHFHEQGRE